MKHLRPAWFPGVPAPPLLAALALPLAVLLGLGAAAPEALAADGDSHYHLSLTVHEDDTVDLSLVFAEEGMTQDEVEDGCDDSSSYFDTDDVDVTPSLQVTELDSMPACSVRLSGMTFSDLEELNSGSTTVTHTDGTYELVVEVGNVSESENVRVSATFPGKVDEASGNGSISKNTVTWENVESDAELRATAADSPGLPWVWILAGGAVVLVVGVVVGLLVVRRRRAPSAGLPQQPGYAPPAAPGAPPVGGQAGPAAGPQPPVAPQPGYVAQPQGPGAPGRPGQVLPDVPTPGQVGPGQVPPGAPRAPGQGQAPGVTQPPGQPGQGPVYPPQDPGAQR